MKLNILSRITFLSVNTRRPKPSAFTEQITVDRKCYGEPMAACCITMFGLLANCLTRGHRPGVFYLRNSGIGVRSCLIRQRNCRAQRGAGCHPALPTNFHRRCSRLKVKILLRQQLSGDLCIRRGVALGLLTSGARYWRKFLSIQPLARARTFRPQSA